MSEKPPHLRLLNAEQELAVVTTHGPLLILAGAGSGKTRVLTRRVAHMLHMGIDAKNILAVTFTNKAAAEMKERIHELVGEPAEGVWVSTFHSTCARILRTDIEALGWTRRFAIYDDDDQARIVRELLERSSIEKELIRPRTKELLSFIDRCKTRLETPDTAVHKRLGKLTDIAAWREYEEALKASDAVDFNDLIGLTVRLFREHGDVLHRWRERFKFIMVDEYQDTNPQQYELLRLLAPDGDSNLGVVGDDDQSIYGFRGADISIILNFQDDYPAATVIKLEQNYRCSNNILTLANEVVAKNTGRFDKRLWTSAAAGDTVVLKSYPSPEAEADGVATGVVNVHQRLKVPWSDIAIIYRTNAIGRSFEAALMKRSVPYRVVGGRKFYEHREIRDVLSYLRLVVNPADDAALLRVINVPSRGVGSKTIAKLRKDAEGRGVPILQAARSVSSADAKAKGVRAFVAIIDELTEAARTQKLEELIGTMLERTGYRAALQDVPEPVKTGEDATAQLGKVKISRENQERLKNLAQLQLQAKALVFAEDVTTPMDQLRWWLDRVALAGQTDELPDGGEVTLMTVHCAKGLEYPIVFVVQMMQGIFPHAKSLETGLDEERRLAYVAFTRAKQRLFVTRSARMPGWSGGADGQRANQEAKAAAPSAFLFGIPAAVCSGDVPAAHEEPGLEELREEVELEDRRSRFMKQHASFSREHEPEGDYRVIELTEAEDLREGVRVRHRLRGFGIVRSVRWGGGRAQVKVDFGRRAVDVSGKDLELVID